MTIVHPGEINPHAGPDFFNARIRIGPIVWAGNVEVHHRASDWTRHGHHLDPVYNNVILHVVGIPDAEVFNSSGRSIPCLVVKYEDRLEEVFNRIRISDDQLPCSYLLHRIPGAFLSGWLKTLLRDRMMEKSARIYGIYEQKGGDWEETLYISLASGYGLPVNLLPFEMLASALPLSSLVDLRDDRMAIEALLFGQSGLLEPVSAKAPYVRTLRKLYRELHDPFQTPPIPGYLWKFLRLRPASFPTLRISQFAGLVQKKFPALKDILGPGTLPELEQIFRTASSSYWENHYRFGRISPPRAKYAGQQFVLSLIINSVVPFLYVYAVKEKKRPYLDLCTDILRQAKAESNHIIKKWDALGIKPANAFETQALIHLYRHYCLDRRCLECWLGRWCIENLTPSN